MNSGDQTLNGRAFEHPDNKANSKTMTKERIAHWSGLAMVRCSRRSFRLALEKTAARARLRWAEAAWLAWRVREKVAKLVTHFNQVEAARRRRYAAAAQGTTAAAVRRKRKKDGRLRPLYGNNEVARWLAGSRSRPDGWRRGFASDGARTAMAAPAH